MAAAIAVPQLVPPLRPGSEKPPSIVVGITHAQTCLVLAARLRALRKAGFQVTVVSSPGEHLNRIAESEGVNQVALPMCRHIAPFADLLSLIRLCRLLRRLKPDLVEFSTPKAGLLGSLAAMLCGVPGRVYMLRGLRLETLSGWRRQLLLFCERLASACAHAVLCNSESLRARAIELRIAHPDKLHLLGVGSSNGVDMERFSPGPTSVRHQLGIPAHVPVVGFVGRLTRDKGLPELIRAFDKLAREEPHVRLLLVGWFDSSDDAIDDVLRARIVSHPRIHCTGFVADTAPYFRAMDVMVLPTWREGFPNVVLEAASTGIPVITTESTGSRDSVLPEVTGLLIPPGYSEAICEAILRLLRDSGLRARMGIAARAWVLEHYMEERVLGLTADYYLSLLDTLTLPSSTHKIESALAPS